MPTAIRSALQAAAVDLVARKTQVLFTTGTRATQAASAATQDIPIVFVHPGDPRTAGMIKSGSEVSRKLKRRRRFRQPYDRSTSRTTQRTYA